MCLMNSLIKKGEMQHSVGPVEHEVLTHQREPHLKYKFRAYYPYIDGRESKSILGRTK